MRKYNRWEIWRARVPYEEKRGSKERPVLILNEDTMIVLSLKMTSHEPRYKKLQGEYEVMEWKKAGLEKPTVIQCSKLLRLDKKLMGDYMYGKLSAVDIVGIQAMLKYMGIIK